MKQQLVELERIHFTRAFPWVNLFRAFRLALDIRKMILGAAALLLLGGGLYAFSYLPLDFSNNEIQALRQLPWEMEWDPLSGNRSDISQTSYWNYLGYLLIRPFQTVFQPLAGLVGQPVSFSWSRMVLYWTQVLWAFCVWSFFGTAISRMSAVQFAVDQRVSLKDALKFAGSKWLWVISAPLMPLAGILILWICCVICGLIGRLPGLGPVLLAGLWIIPLLLSFAIVLLFIGLAFGWPLMIATVSTQGSDAFDGFSRSFDYVYSRFWHLIWFLIVATVHGLLMLALVIFISEQIVLLAMTFVQTGLGNVAKLPYTLVRGISAWQSVISMLVAGYAVSYFWTSSTIIYFLLRQSEDANHLIEVYLPETAESEDLVQLAGVAASDQPITERPAKHNDETRQQPPADSDETS